MKAVKFLNKFFAIIFLIAFSILILLMMLIGIAKTMFTEESISKYVVNANIFNSPTSKILGENDNNTLKESISNKLLEMKIPEEVTERVLYSNELNDVITNYAYEHINNILFDTNKETIANEKIINIIQNKYFEIEGQSLNTNQINMLNDYITELNLKLTNSTLDINELASTGLNINILRIIDNICHSKYIWFILGTFILVTYTMIAICLKNKKTAFKWCSNALVIDGIILVLFSFLEVKFLSMYINNKGIIDNLVITMVNNSFENLLFYGIALIIVGIILLIICSVLSKKERKENSDVLLNSTIENEIKNNKISSYDIIKENNELEMEKVSLDKIPEEKIVNKVYIKENKEIPKIIIKGNDFEKSDIDNIKPHENITSQNNKIHENSDVLQNTTIENEMKNKKISSYDIVKENNELEIEKVSLDKIPEEKIVNKVYIKENKEIPKIIIEGNDFEKSDKVSVKPNQDIFKEIENYQSDKENKKLENNEISYELLKEKTNNEEDKKLKELLDDDIEFIDVEDSKKEDINKSEELNEIEIIEIETDDIEEEPKSTKSDNIDYEEIEEHLEEEPVKKDVKVFPIEEVELTVVSPKKGKDIKANLEIIENEEDEEEIEIL